MDYLTQQPIDLAALIQVVTHPERGGMTVFVGTVRCGPDDGQVAAIEYSAYDEMVGPEFGRIMAEATSRWPSGSVVAQHRVGRIAVGEASIAIVAAAPHRDEAFALCRYVIEETKRRVPIWKKEVFEEGQARWRSNRAAEEVSE